MEEGETSPHVLDVLPLDSQPCFPLECNCFGIEVEFVYSQLYMDLLIISKS